MLDKLANIRSLPNVLLQQLPQLIVNRHGEMQDAMMISCDIAGYVLPNASYQFKRVASHFTLARSENLHTSMMASKKQNNTSPPIHARLKGEWIHHESTKKTDANILGGMGSLLMTSDVLSIPVIEATPETLAFYHAKLLSLNDTLQFETMQALPIVHVKIGKNYVEHYLTQKGRGDGHYIEYHDQPHLWIPQTKTSIGHVLLGRKIADQFYLTGFRIPYATALYMSPFTLHSDAYLIGSYQVVYTVTREYSTVIFKTLAQRPGQLTFIDEI